MSACLLKHLGQMGDRSMAVSCIHLWIEKSCFVLIQISTLVLLRFRGASRRMVDMEATQMKRKIEISGIDRIVIIAALMAYGWPMMANRIHDSFEAADPTNDGPEIDIICNAGMRA